MARMWSAYDDAGATGLLSTERVVNYICKYFYSHAYPMEIAVCFSTWEVGAITCLHPLGSCIVLDSSELLPRPLG